ncbi:MAG: hypothetical protein EBU96_02225 [Actinobacteria bacterium]|nr:hypothetical protein [Actinomycetota bacterium]
MCKRLVSRATVNMRTTITYELKACLIEIGLCKAFAISNLNNKGRAFLLGLCCFKRTVFIEFRSLGFRLGP